MSVKGSRSYCLPCYFRRIICTDMQTISEIVAPVTALFLTLLALWIFCRITRAAYNKLYGFLYKIAPEGSFLRRCAGIALWIAMVGVFAWFMRDELKINNKQLFAFLSIWSLAIVIFAVLVKVLPDGIFKRVCGWIFLAVAFEPLLWLCFRLLGKRRTRQQSYLASRFPRYSRCGRGRRGGGFQKRRAEKTVEVRNDPSIKKFINPDKSHCGFCRVPFMTLSFYQSSSISRKEVFMKDYMHGKPHIFLLFDVRFVSTKPQRRLRHLLPFASLQQTAHRFFVKSAPLLEVKRYFVRQTLIAHVRHPLFPQRSRFRTAFATQNHPMNAIKG